MAWRLATSPTSTSPVFENATTDGVVRAPSELGMTAGSPASRVDTTELVVPRSIPTALLIRDVLRDLSPLVSTYVSQPTASPVNPPPIPFPPTQPAGRRTQPRRGPEGAGPVTVRRPDGETEGPAPVHRRRRFRSRGGKPRPPPR